MLLLQHNATDGGTQSIAAIPLMHAPGSIAYRFQAFPVATTNPLKRLAMPQETSSTYSSCCFLPQCFCKRHGKRASHNNNFQMDTKSKHSANENQQRNTYSPCLDHKNIKALLLPKQRLSEAESAQEKSISQKTQQTNKRYKKALIARNTKP